MKYFLSVTTLLFCLLCVSSCKNKGTESKEAYMSATDAGLPANNVVNPKVVLSVGQEQFTVFELQKNYNYFKHTFSQNNKREPKEDDIKDWIKEFTERAYVLADARSKGYYSRKDVQEIVEVTAAFMLSQPHGILDQKLTVQDLHKTGDSEQEKRATLKEYHTRVNNAASLNTNITEVKWLGTVLSKYKKKTIINKEDIEGALNKKLASYRTPDGNTKDITMEEFMTYYNNLPLKRPLDYTESIINNLRQIAAIDYIKKDAKEMGILNDDEFRLNKRNFTNNVVYKKYMEEQSDINIPVSDQEILNIYNVVKTTMTHPTNIVYSIFTFNSAPEAFKALSFIHSMKPGDTTLNLNTLSEKKHIKFDENRSALPDTLKKMLLRVPVGQATPPVVAPNGFYSVLVVESATGSKPYHINEIKPYLIARAKEQREINYSHRKALELNNTYKKTGEIAISLFSGI